VKKLLVFALCCALAGSLTNLNGQDITPSGILPGEKPVKGWKQKKVPESFPGEDLYQAIDGAAEVYIEYGFVSMARSSYSSGKKSLNIEIYMMADPEAAYGIMTLMNDGNPFKVSDGKVVVTRDYYGMLLKGRFYAIITDPTGKGALLNEIEKFSEMISEKIKEAAVVPEIISKADMRGIEKIILFRGDIVLHNQYFFGIPRPFDFDKGVFLQKKGDVKILFSTKNSETADRNIRTTLEHLEKTGNYKVDYRSQSLISTKGDTLKVRREGDLISVSAGKQQ
jgi:hypothetical protein